MDIDNFNTTSVFAGFTFIATGGVGQLFTATTNPCISTGDGIGMALRAGADTKDMEFIQFHPTALFDEDNKKGQIFLISEAVRGLGAKLINHSGESFMPDYDNRSDLAPRDVVSRAIQAEILKAKKNFMFLDCRNIDPDKFDHYFPEIKRKCLETGINPKQQLIISYEPTPT